MVAEERLTGARVDAFLDRVLPALRGHLGIRSGDLVALARELDLLVPTGDPAARGEEWAALLARLAGVKPLAAAEGRPLALLPVVRDLTDLIEGTVAPVAWWQRLLGGGNPPPLQDPAAGRLLVLCRRLADGIDLPPDLVRPLIGRFSGALSEAETGDLATRLADLGRAGWLDLGARGVNSAVWGSCYDVLAPAAREAADRHLGLLYDAGY